jgi:hypothetical protein
MIRARAFDAYHAAALVFTFDAGCLRRAKDEGRATEKQHVCAV